MTRPLRNVVVLVALDLNDIQPGPGETISDAVSRFLLERVGPEADTGEGVAVSAVVYTDPDEVLEDFRKGHLASPGVYEGDDWSVLGTIDPERII